MTTLRAAASVYRSARTALIQLHAAKLPDMINTDANATVPPINRTRRRARAARERSTQIAWSVVTGSTADDAADAAVRDGG